MILQNAGNHILNKKENLYADHSKKISDKTPNIASSYSKEQIKKAVKKKNKGEIIKWQKL